MGAFLSSCASEGPQYETDVYGDLGLIDPSGQTIIYWYQYAGSQEEALTEMIDGFNVSNEWGITVQGEYAGDYGEIYDKVIDGIPTGEIPPLIVAYQSQAAAYAAQDALVELTPYIEDNRWGLTGDEVEDLLPFAQGENGVPQFEGRYGFAQSRSMEVLYYNIDWLNELGYDHPPRTWDEFHAMACSASDLDAGTYGYELSLSPTSPHADLSTFADMLINHGGRMLNDSATAYAFNDENGIGTLSFIQGLFDDNCAIVETDRYGAQEGFGAGRVLFTIDSTTALPHYVSAVVEGAGFNWNVAPLPTSLDAPHPDIYGADFYIPRTDPEQQLAAWLFVKWFAEPEQQARWVRASDHFPIRYASADLLEDYLEENPHYQEAFTFLAYTPAIEPGVTGYQACREEITDMVRDVINGAALETELSDAEEACNASLAE
jgi:multiple sugar transport system substrate-binding protein/sn-glycerol 3-phosphate transport system substrate-binding protein